jgi:hypothetical protein
MLLRRGPMIIIGSVYLILMTLIGVETRYMLKMVKRGYKVPF